MAKSKAKKQRQKLVRQGRRNPEAGRSPYVQQDMRTRKSKTKKDHMYQFKHKNHHFHVGDNGFCCFYCPSSVNIS